MVSMAEKVNVAVRGGPSRPSDLKLERGWLYYPDFPDRWERQSLYSLAQWVNGLAFRSIQFSPMGKPVIKISEIKGGISGQTRFTQQTFDESVLVRRGDLLFSWSGQPETSIDAFWWNGQEGWLNQHIFRVTPNLNVDRTFFYYLLRYLKPNFVGIARNKQTTGLGHVTKRDMESMEVGLPPLPEQRAIAHVLGTLDDKIELNRRMNETLEQMARALFKSWFVDFEPVRAKMDGRWRRGESLPGLPAEHYDLFPDRLVPSELGEIPEGWEVKALGEVVDVVGGTTPSTKVAEYWDGGAHCWATPKDLSALSSPVLLDTERKVTDAGLRQIGSGLLPKGTLLLSSRAPIGYLAVSEEPVAINQGFIAMPPRKGISTLFMLYWCGVFHDEIINHANGSTFLEISKRNFRSIPLLAPPEAVLTAFDRLAHTLHEHMVSNERESRALATQRDVLLPGLVSGEVGGESRSSRLDDVLTKAKHLC